MRTTKKWGHSHSLFFYTIGGDSNGSYNGDDDDNDGWDDGGAGGGEGKSEEPLEKENTITHLCSSLT